ncbi:MAG: glycosyltransferase family 2 protein [Thermoleophilaceae bacterium]|nr:glycosyltransferase family 2 protein [Thermoleophilaceae bacterium]
MRASVVIAAWNADGVLDACLDSLVETGAAGDVEVIVVDDGSTDSTAALLADRSDSVRSIRNERSVGYCAAINQGAELASGQALLLCNADIEFGPDALDGLLRALDRPGIGLAIPRYHRPDGSLQPGCSRFPTIAGASLLAAGLHRLLPDRLRAHLAPTHWSHRWSRNVDVAMGAVVAIEAELFRALGGYWPLMYGSESDLAFRAAGRGQRVRFVAEAEVMHVGNHSNRRRWSDPERARRIASSELVFLETHYGRSRRMAIRAITGAGFGLRWITLSLLRRPKRAAEYAAMVRVYVRGVD